ncbi:MAG: RNA-binding protein [Desulfobulbaceae bacterium]|nr:RNA-binding protein [Desulfobulbaceae bacterium]
MELYVGNLTYNMTELELKTLFSCHGLVKSAQIVTDHFTRQSKCFGYVKMQCNKDASKAVELLNGKTVNKRFLVVKKARSRDERQGRPW